jgi:glycosyltransferase involved in cell wall biosynthesis
VSGGFVKCLDLAERFPNVSLHPNLLYLVSSALPERRELLARAAKRAGGRFVLNQNGVAYPAWAGARWREWNAPNARVHAAADYVIYQSEFCRECARRFLGNRNGKSEILYNPVDTKTFVPRAECGQENRPMVLLVAGSHHDAYRVRLAIQAFAGAHRKKPNIRLLLAGRMVWSPTANEEARAWTNETGLASLIEFHGAYTQANAPELFRRADVLLHLKVQDPCPRLVVEAMACGLPIRYSATGGTPELVGAKAGIGIPGKNDFERINPPPLDEVIEAILWISEGRGEMACHARTRAVETFSVEAWLENHARIFAHLAEKRLIHRKSPFYCLFGMENAFCKRHYAAYGDKLSKILSCWR